jgi:fermentation-respiration switch protein FrsA (DUF1100 family)
MNRTDTSTQKPLGPLLNVALAAWTLSLAFIVGMEGSIVWQILRVGLVTAIGAAAFQLSMSHRRLGALLLIGLSTIGLAAGFAFGFRFLTIDGPSLKAVAGFIHFGAGLVLLFGGAARLLSTFKPAGRLALSPVLFLAVAISAWIVTPAVMVTNMPPVDIGQTPADIGLAASNVSFTTDDGVKLQGWYVPSANGAAVILRHGASSTGSNVLAHAAVLAKHGYGVLITDARGHGRSGGRAMDFGWHGNSDIAAALDFLETQTDIDQGRIGIVGLSMGGEEALGAVGSDLRIAAVLAEGATARTDADKAWLAEVYGFRGRLQVGIERLQYALTDVLTAASKPVALADSVSAVAPRPVLLIAGENMPDEIHAAEHIRDRAPQSVEIWVVPDAGHIEGLQKAAVEWEMRVIGFLDDTLLKSN